MTDTDQIQSIDTIIDDFAFLDDWEDRYRYVIELGRTLAPLADGDRTPANKVEGCVSQVWLATTWERDPGGSGNGSSGNGNPRLSFVGDSDALIVRGLIAILHALYSGRTASEILAIDAAQTFETLGLRDHLTAQRSNGLTAMVGRIRADAALALKRQG